MTEDNRLEEVKARLMLAETFSAGWHKNIGTWRNLYDQQHYVGALKPKAGEVRYNDPTLTNTVDLAVGILLGNEMRLKAWGWKPSQREEKDSSTIEKYLSAVIQINDARNEYSAIYESSLNFVRDGGAVLLSVWDKEIAKRSLKSIEQVDPDSVEVIKKAKAYLEPPTRLEVIDPLEIFVAPGGPNRWLAVARVQELSVYEVESTYGITLTEHSGKSSTDKLSIKANFVDYWDLDPDNKVRNALLFAGEFLPGYDLKVSNGYKDIPYTIGFFKPTDRKESALFSNIMTPMIESVGMLERNTNHTQRLTDMYSNLPLVAQTNDGKKLTVDPGVGKFVQLRVGEQFGFAGWQGTPPDMKMQTEFFRSKIQQSGFSDMMYGSGQSQASGYALSQLGDQNRIRLEQPISHIEMLWARWARKTLDITIQFGKGKVIRAYGQVREQDFADEIGVDTLSGYFVSCEIQPDFPNERVRNHAMATQVMSILSPQTIMQRYLNIQQPDEEEERKLISEMRNHPIAKTYAMMGALKEEADTGDEIAAMTLDYLKAQLMSQGIGEPGRPTEPNNSEQLTGTQSANGDARPPQESSQALVSAFKKQITNRPTMKA